VARPPNSLRCDEVPVEYVRRRARRQGDGRRAAGAAAVSRHVAGRHLARKL